MSDPSKQERPRRLAAPNLSWLFAYTTVVSCAGSAVLLWAALSMSLSGPRLLLFLGLVGLAELINIEGLVPQISFSISSAVSFATLLTFGPLPGALAGAVGGFAATLMREMTDRQRNRDRAPFLQRVFFNVAALGLAAFVAGHIYVGFGGRIGAPASAINIIPMLLAALCVEFCNAAIIIGAISLQTQRPISELWLQNVSWAIPMSVFSMALGGGGMALGYQIAGVLGLVVFFLPIGMTIYAFRLYVTRTKGQMASLEEIIEERTADLQTANEELKRLDRIKTTFFSTINHEMRTPLTAILGYTHLLVRQDALNPSQKRMINIVEESSRQLLDLVNSLLDISALEDGKLNICPSAIELSPAVDRALAVVRPMADRKTMTLNVDIPDALPGIYADPKRVDQILINLVTNAIKYTHDTGTVVIAAREDDAHDEVRVSVADNGMGIPADVLPHLFSRFVRSAQAEQSNAVGSGLGLSITKGLVEAQGGRIWVESIEGEGTTFTFTLPVANDGRCELIDSDAVGAGQQT